MASRRRAVAPSRLDEEEYALVVFIEDNVKDIVLASPRYLRKTKKKEWEAKYSDGRFYKVVVLERNTDKESLLRKLTVLGGGKKKDGKKNEKKVGKGKNGSGMKTKGEVAQAVAHTKKEAKGEVAQAAAHTKKEAKGEVAQAAARTKKDLAIKNGKAQEKHVLKKRNEVILENMRKLQSDSQRSPSPVAMSIDGSDGSRSPSPSPRSPSPPRFPPLSLAPATAPATLTTKPQLAKTLSPSQTSIKSFALPTATSSTPKPHTLAKASPKTSTGKTPFRTSTTPSTASTSKPSTPPTSKPSTPSTSKPSTPSTSKPSTPSTSKLSTPSTSKPSTPSTSKPSTPSTSKPSTPSTSKPSTPSTSTPSTSKPSTPSTSRLSTPSTSKPIPSNQNKSGCRECKEKEAKIKALEEEMAMLRRRAAISNEGEHQPRPGKLSVEVAEENNMVELSPGTNVYTFQHHLTEGSRKKNDTGVACYLLSCFYTAAELMAAGTLSSLDPTVVSSIIDFAVRAKDGRPAVIKQALRCKIQGLLHRAKKGGN